MSRVMLILWHPNGWRNCEVFVPSPFVFERHQLIDVGGAVDDAFVLSALMR